MTSFITYYLIKLLPIWGVALVGTVVAFLGPLIYLENKELIDSQLEHAGHIINQQTHQIKEVTAQQTSKGLESVKQYTGTYAAKAQEVVGSARQKIPSPTTNTTSKSVNEADFPSAPKSDFNPSSSEAPKIDFTATSADAPKIDFLGDSVEAPKTGTEREPLLAA